MDTIYTSYCLIHWVAMVRAGSDEHPVRTMVRCLSNSFSAHSVVIRTMETPDLYQFAPFKAVV